MKERIWKTQEDLLRASHVPGTVLVDEDKMVSQNKSDPLALGKQWGRKKYTNLFNNHSNLCIASGCNKFSFETACEKQTWESFGEELAWNM